MCSCHYLLPVEIVAEGTTSAFLWRPSWLSSGKNLLRFPLISSPLQCVPLGKNPAVVWSRNMLPSYITMIDLETRARSGLFWKKTVLTLTPVSNTMIQFHFSPTSYF